MSIYIKNIVIITVVLILCSDVMAQSTNIKGVVFDIKTNPLPGANIYIEGAYDGTSSDVNGIFSFTTNETGKHVLRVDYIGFEPYREEVELNGKNIIIEPHLVESFNQLKAITIIAGSFEASETKKAVILKPLDIVTTAGALGDISGAMQTLPGTSTIGESGRLFVRGGHSGEAQTYIDGTLVHEPYTTSAPNTAVRGRFNPFMFSGTVFSTGGYSAEYGQALSSVLLLRTNGLQQEDQLDISIMSIGTGVAGTKLWESGAVTASFDYMNLTPYMQLIPQNVNWNKYPQSYNGAISVRQKTGKRGLLKTYITYDKSSFSLEQEDPDYLPEIPNNIIDNQYVYFNTSWRGTLNKKWSLKTGVSTTGNLDINDLGTDNYRGQLHGANAKIVLANQISEKINIRFGTEYFYKYFSAKYNKQPYPENYLLDFTSNMISGFAEVDIYASNKFVTRVGGRYEYSDWLKKYNFAPRISAAYKVDDKSQFSFAYGIFFQDPANEYLIYTGKLDFERANHFILNYQTIKENRTFRAEVYYKDYNDLVKYQLTDHLVPTNHNNSGSAYAYGLDIFWRDRKTIRNGDYWISYSYIDSKRNFRDYPYKAIPDFVSKHNFSLVYKHWIGELRSQLGFTLKYSSPRCYNDPNKTEFNSELMTPYRTLNMNWSFLCRQNIIIYASISNVPGFKQEYGYTYASFANDEGFYESVPVIPDAKRFYFIGCFITLTERGRANQLDKLE
ncbi:MAG: TonB-dependent receptor [Bacteroidales bacterium]|nr:TonB-dependent receptor [Bacteroidales bacterium]